MSGINPYDAGFQLGQADAGVALAERGSGPAAIWQRQDRVEMPDDLGDRQRFLFGYADGLRRGAALPEWVRS
jgi:hypothetical protein